VAVTQTVAPARSDARRNRDLLVTAARELFASEGVHVPAREVASLAGVGVGTLYRHFPTREDLVDAVLEDAFAEVISIAEAALAESDAWRGFRRYVEGALVLYGRNRGLKQTAEIATHDRERVQAMKARIRPLTTKIVARAKGEGGLRADFKVEDIRMILSATDRAVELAGDDRAGRRYLGFVLDGLRRTR
jgi:AcrR family transcriptional regulator